MTVRALPFSAASERNKGPILAVLQREFAAARTVLEIGSGTGQHAVHFARGMPWLQWQPTDVAMQLPDLQARLTAEAPANVRAARALDVDVDDWPEGPFDAVFSANTLHILSWPQVERFWSGIERALGRPGVVAVYGPFKYGGAFTTPSNAAFDASLRARDPASGVRDFERVDALARAAGLELTADHALPANNQLLVWRR
ncbi:MAG: class I SAM-dependent methyltransferase [Steroidobacteraceae bacterium]|nr:class I SAM-dependent methyltransferase [Steroidobacteraceae bacterium]MDW8258224.1 DUF938 domain-containing protein [Gammaproteobacteria bacterium]